MTLLEMTTDQAAEITFLRSLPLFAGLGERELETLRILCHRRRHPPGAVILRQGQLGSDLYMVRSGAVSVRLRQKDGSDCELVQLGPGALFGEMALFDNYPRSASVVAVGAVETLSLSEATFTGFARAHPAVLFQFCRVFAHRIRDTNSLLTRH